MMYSANFGMGDAMLKHYGANTPTENILEQRRKQDPEPVVQGPGAMSNMMNTINSNPTASAAGGMMSMMQGNNSLMDQGAMGSMRNGGTGAMSNLMGVMDDPNAAMEDIGKTLMKKFLMGGG